MKICSFGLMVAILLTTGMLISCHQSSANPVVTAVISDNSTDPLILAENGVRSNDEWLPLIREFDGVPMALVPRGSFMMGLADEFFDYYMATCEMGTACYDLNYDQLVDEKPAHEIIVLEPYWIDVYEVSVGQFEQINGVAANPPEWDAIDYPRTNITWFEADAYCASRGARLPTEAEWEYAARGPDSLMYPWGDTFASEYVIDDYPRSDEVPPHPVGGSLGDLSWVGSVDMAGNAAEWVHTIFAGYPYQGDDGREADGVVDSVSDRTIRGGAWSGEAEGSFRLTARDDIPPDFYYYSVGFRCVRDYVGPE